MPAIDNAWEVYQWWSSLKFEGRAEYLLHAAEILKSRIYGIFWHGLHLKSVKTGLKLMLM
jgi:hypothetical protein